MKYCPIWSPCLGLESALLSKSLCLAPALGVTLARDMILAHFVVLLKAYAVDYLYGSQLYLCIQFLLLGSCRRTYTNIGPGTRGQFVEQKLMLSSSFRCDLSQRYDFGHTLLCYLRHMPLTIFMEVSYICEYNS